MRHGGPKRLFRHNERDTPFGVSLLIFLRMDVRTVFCTEKCCCLFLRGWQRLLCRYGCSYRRDRSRPLRGDLRQTGGQLLKGAYLVADLLIQHRRLGCDGLIEAGKLGDLVIWDAPDLDYICYRFGSNLAKKVIKRGRVM